MVGIIAHFITPNDGVFESGAVVGIDAASVGRRRVAHDVAAIKYRIVPVIDAAAVAPRHVVANQALGEDTNSVIAIVNIHAAAVTPCRVVADDTIADGDEC